MRRTNIYLPDEQLEALKRLGAQRGEPMSEMVREAVDRWLETQGVRLIGEDEWRARFRSLLERRRGVAAELQPSPRTVERDVATSVEEARRARPARRR